jgi:hypothetical protein
MAVTFSILRLASPHSTAHATASATISQETLNEPATSVQDSFFVQNTRKAANCFVTGDLPVAHGTCSSIILSQYRQLTLLIVYNKTTIMFHIGGSRNSRCFKWSYVDPVLPHLEHTGLLFNLGVTGTNNLSVLRHNRES